MACNEQCATCSDFNTCLTCRRGYYVSSNESSLWFQCPDEGCELYHLDGICYDCLDGYYLVSDNNTCQPCHQSCSACHDSSDNCDVIHRILRCWCPKMSSM